MNERDASLAQAVADAVGIAEMFDAVDKHGNIRKPRQNYAHPLDELADKVADTVRAKKAAAPSSAIVIAWITAQGDLWCAGCVQPTDAAAADMLPVYASTDGKPEQCDLCPTIIEGEA